MKLKFFFLMRFLFSKKSGSLVRSIAYLSIFGIAVSVAACILVVSIMLGFNDSIHERSLAIQPYIEISLEEANPQLEQSLNEEWKDIGAHVFSAEKQDLILRTLDGLFSGVEANAYTQEEWNWVWQKIKIYEMEIEDITLQENHIFVGFDLARELGIYEGDEVVLLSPESILTFGLERPIYEKVKVQRVVQTNVPEYDSKAIFYDPVLSLGRLKDNPSLQKELHIRLKDKNNYPSLLQKVKDKNFSFQTWEDRNKALLYALKVERYAMGSFLFFTLIIASFSIFTVLSLLVNQKRKDIGILLSLGMHAQQIRSLFTLMGMFLSSVGVFLGGGFAVLFSAALDRYEFLNLPSEIYYDHKVPIRLEWSFVWWILVSSLLIAYFGSLLPSLWGSREKPVDLLRNARLKNAFRRA